MATTLGTAYVQIRPTAEGIKGAIADTLGPEAGSAGTKAGGLFSSGFLGKMTKGLAIGTAAIGGFTAAAGAGLSATINKTAQYGDEIDKMSQKLGFSTDAYQKWDYVLKISGSSIQNMEMGMKTLTNRFDDARNGSKGAIDSFGRLGLSMEDLEGMSREDLFGTVIQQLQSVEDETERAALANDFFGRSGQDLIPLLNQDADSTAALIEQAEKYGMVMSEDAVAASAAFQDSITTLNGTITGLKNRLAAEFLPGATMITDGLAKMFTGDMSGVDDVVAGIELMIEKIKELAPKIIEAGWHLISSLGKGLLEKAGDIGSKAGDLIGPLIQGLIAKIPAFASAAGDLIIGFLGGLWDSLPAIGAAIGDLVGNMITWLMDGGWETIGSTILDLLGRGISGAIGALVNIVTSVGSSILKALGLDNLWQKVQETVDKIKGFFNFHVELPHIKLPHFAISPRGWKLGDLLKGVIPKLDISWNAQGGIMEGPTLFGGGEAGPEAIVPLTPFWDRLERFAESMQGGVTINVYGSPGMSVTELATAVEQKLIEATKRRTYAWR